jgi:hypothetical protein
VQLEVDSTLEAWDNHFNLRRLTVLYSHKVSQRPVQSARTHAVLEKRLPGPMYKRAQRLRWNQITRRRFQILSPGIFWPFYWDLRVKHLSVEALSLHKDCQMSSPEKVTVTYLVLYLAPALRRFCACYSLASPPKMPVALLAI